MNKKIQFESEEEKQLIFQENLHLRLIEEQNLITGNFLIFTDEEELPYIQPPETVIYTQVPQSEFETIKHKLEVSESDNISTLEAIADLYEMLLALQGV